MRALAKGTLAGTRLSPAERALMQFVTLVTKHAYRSTRKHVDQLRKHGWTDEQIAEAVYVVGMFAMMNRIADAFGIPPMGYLKTGSLTP
ncbi:MAG TPA: carboxymuconolactone decarboxylase family protein [Terriglobales bacterium]|nr:carboxymuconolactone decarboxylase family protein [Terriglobales bacterium]